MDVPTLVAKASGATPRFLRVELRPGEASVLAATDKDPSTIKSYKIKDGVVANVEATNAIETGTFEVDDVDWSALPERSQQVGIEEGIDVESLVFSMVILPTSKGTGATIRFSVETTRQPKEYERPAKSSR